jgi:outer membrane immunogenic protein
MKRSILAALGLLSLASALPATAADLGRQYPYKAPPVAYVQPAYNWTGFYLGINGGGAWGSSDWSGYGVGSSPSGGMIGLTAGYNWQAPGSQWVFGLEGDIDWTSISGSTSCGIGVNCHTENSWLGTVRGRVGYAFDRFMPYVTGGGAFGNIKANPTGWAGVDDSHAGWTVGVGLEAALNGRWTAKVEYLYADLGSVGCSSFQCGSPVNVDLTMNIVRAGLNYRF